MKLFFVLLSTLLSVQGVTKEFVRVYQPLSMHETDSSNDLAQEGTLLQAEVFSRPMVLSGAFPEDLVKAVATPCQPPSNNPDYTVQEVNLVVLCGLSFELARDEEKLSIWIDLKEYKKPEEVDVSLSKVCEMTVESIRRTLRSYYRAGGAEAGIECWIRFTGPEERVDQVEHLATRFMVPLNS
ncbi:MAG: hypothetical protein Q7Q71_06870 [Verrucomicrobiota bacterium JB023]|nr:hypothetical protein [Verrucomicrobiota bacterium JB023]